jgi:hypothetical protein
MNEKRVHGRTRLLLLLPKLFRAAKLGTVRYAGAGVEGARGVRETSRVHNGQKYLPDTAKHKCRGGRGLMSRRPAHTWVGSMDLQGSGISRVCLRV